MLDWLVNAVLQFVREYGYVAVFAYMVLETAFILHFAPSEIVIPFAARHLVSDRASFGLFVIVTTCGATLGAMLTYYVFATYGEAALERFGHVLHIDDDDLERGQAWFRRWGENSVLWCRMLPVMRAVISMPAGMAEMSLKKFVAYSALGSAVFNVLFTWLVYSGANAHSPLELMVMYSENVVAPLFQSVHLTVLVGGLTVGTGWWTWRQREKLVQRFDY